MVFIIRSLYSAIMYDSVTSISLIKVPKSIEKRRGWYGRDRDENRSTHRDLVSINKSTIIVIAACSSFSIFFFFFVGKYLMKLFVIL